MPCGATGVLPRIGTSCWADNGTARTLSVARHRVNLFICRSPAIDGCYGRLHSIFKQRQYISVGRKSVPSYPYPDFPTSNSFALARQEFSLEIFCDRSRAHSSMPVALCLEREARGCH